jgi:hypothetical protein
LRRWICSSLTTMPSPLPSSMYLQAAFAARRPSVNEPDEKACGVPPTASPAPNRPSIVVMRL